MDEGHESGIDLDAYLQRIGYTGPVEPSLETLKGLHLAHAMAIPFKNLDVLVGKPIRLDPEGLQEKLVRHRRGGYCFEQNGLFAFVLEQSGFTITRLAARVRWGSQSVLPRTHMAIKVEVDGTPWLADVGFGGWGLLEPIVLKADVESPQFAWAYRLVREGEAWVLQAPQETGWQDLYVFTLEPQLPIDYEPSNYYVSNYQDSIFRKLLIVQRPTPEARFIIRDRQFLVFRPTGIESHAIEDDAEVTDLFRRHFGLNVTWPLSVGED